MQVLGLRREDTAAWTSYIDGLCQMEGNMEELLVLAAACPGVNGGGLKLVTDASEPLMPFDDEHTASLAHYMPGAFGRVRGRPGNYPEYS